MYFSVHVLKCEFCFNEFMSAVPGAGLSTADGSELNSEFAHIRAILSKLTSIPDTDRGADPK